MAVSVQEGGQTESRARKSWHWRERGAVPQGFAMTINTPLAAFPSTASTISGTEDFGLGKGVAGAGCAICQLVVSKTQALGESTFQ